MKSKLAAALLACLLISCGGGSDDGGGTTSRVALTNVRVPSVDQEVFYGGDPLTPVVVLADVSGDLSALSTVYVVVEDPDELFSEARVISGVNGINNQLTVYGRSVNLKAGHFTGPLRVFVCLDARCQQPIGGTPVSIPYTITVLPGIEFLPTSSTVDYRIGSNEPVRLPFSLPQGLVSWNAEFWGPSSIGVSTTLAPTPAVLLNLSSQQQPATFEGGLQITATGTTSKGRQAQTGYFRRLQFRVTQ